MAMGGLNRTQGLLEDQLHFEVLDLSTRSQWVIFVYTSTLSYVCVEDHVKTIIQRFFSAPHLTWQSAAAASSMEAQTIG